MKGTLNAKISFKPDLQKVENRNIDFKNDTKIFGILKYIKSRASYN